MRLLVCLLVIVVSLMLCMPHAHAHTNNSSVLDGVVNGDYLGVDVSQLTSEDSFACMKKSGYSFAVVRAWQSACRVDPNAAASVKNAWAAGLAHVDVYLFPAFKCSLSAAQQVETTVNHLRQTNTKFGMLWLDIEASGSGWSSDPAANKAWLDEAVFQGQAMHVNLGIYSSRSGWQASMGNSAGWTTLPLWYAHYDDKRTFSDFVPFAGWNKPAVKQYKGTTAFCSASVDLNWYP